jgi:hypothetical protein
MVESINRDCAASSRRPWQVGQHLVDRGQGSFTTQGIFDAGRFGISIRLKHLA